MSPHGQARFFVARFLLICGTVAAMWRQYNLVTAGVALGAYYLLERISFGIYYNRELKRLARRYVELSAVDAKKQNKTMNEDATSREAIEIATRIIRSRVKGKNPDEYCA